MYTVEEYWKVNDDVAVEGFSERWQEMLVENARLLDKGQRRSYLLALRVLDNASLCQAYLRSEPIWRFQDRLYAVINQIKEMDTSCE